VDRRAWMGIAVGSIAAPAAMIGAWQWRDEWVEKRVAVVVPGRIIRGAWQRPGPLSRILRREKIRTIVTLSAINDDDPKYVDQARVVRESGIGWKFVPIRGSYATVDQLSKAVNLLADPRLQPIFYHCVAGHHRSSQVQAAYRIRQEGWSADRAWSEVAALPWARPDSDTEDRRRIDAFASAQLQRKVAIDASSKVPGQGPPPAPGRADGRGGADRVDPAGLGQLRDRPAG